MLKCLAYNCLIHEQWTWSKSNRDALVHGNNIRNFPIDIWELAFQMYDQLVTFSIAGKKLKLKKNNNNKTFNLILDAEWNTTQEQTSCEIRNYWAIHCH